MQVPFVALFVKPVARAGIVFHGWNAFIESAVANHVDVPIHAETIQANVEEFGIVKRDNLTAHSFQTGGVEKNGMHLVANVV